MQKSSPSNRCLMCDSPAAISRVRRYHYTQSGLENVYLNNSVTQTHCPSCGVIVHIPAEQQLLQVLALVLLEKPRLLVPKELLFLRKACGLTQSVMARLLGVRGHATVAERESGKSQITVETDFYFRAKVARYLWELHMDSPSESYLAPIHVDRLRAQLAKFTELVTLPKQKGSPEVSLVLDHEAWRGQAA